MGVSDTSKIAYDSIKNKGNKALRVYGTISYLGECCNKQIAEWLGWEINRVTGRVNELCKAELIEEVDKRIVPGYSETPVKIFRVIKKNA